MPLGVALPGWGIDKCRQIELGTFHIYSSYIYIHTVYHMCIYIYNMCIYIHMDTIYMNDLTSRRHRKDV